MFAFNIIFPTKTVLFKQQILLEVLLILLMLYDVILINSREHLQISRSLKSVQLMTIVSVDALNREAKLVRDRSARHYITSTVVV